MQKNKVYAVLAILTLLSISFIGGYVYAPTGSTYTISSGIYPGAPSYTIWREGSTYYAKNDMGAIDYQGTNASLIFINALSQLSNGGKIFVKEGLYVFNSSVAIDYNITIQGEGYNSGRFFPTSNMDGTVIYGEDIDIFVIGETNRQTVTFRDLTITGKNPSGEIWAHTVHSDGHGIHVKGANGILIENVHITRKEYGIALNGTSVKAGRIMLNNVDFSYNDFGFITHSVYTNRYVHFNYVHGYAMNRAFINGTFGYDLVLENVDDEGAGWTGYADNTGASIYLGYHRNLWIDGLNIFGGGGGEPSPTRALLELAPAGGFDSGRQAYASLQNIVLMGTNHTGLRVVGNDVYGYRLDMQNFYIGNYPDSLYNWRGGHVNMSTGIEIRNAMRGTFRDGSVYGSTANISFVGTVANRSVKVENVYGFTTTAYDNASGTSPITVTHGLSGTPEVILLTPNADAGDFWYSTITSTTFRIQWDGGGTVAFNWYAEYVIDS